MKINSQHLSKNWRPGMIAALLMLAIPGTALAQIFLYSGATTNITLGPGTYDITAYGADGGYSTIIGYNGGLGAEMEAQFTFTLPTTLTLMVGSAGGDGPGSPRGPGGGGGGTFVVNGIIPLIVAGGGGGGGYNGPGGNGLVTNGGSGGLGGDGSGGAGGGGFSTNGGNGFWNGGAGNSFLNGGEGVGGFYGASGGGFGGGGGGGNYGGGGGGGYTGGSSGGQNAPGYGGGSYIDSSAIAIGTQLSGVASPGDSPNGEVIINAVPEPSSYLLLGAGALGLLLWRGKRSITA